MFKKTRTLWGFHPCNLAPTTGKHRKGHNSTIVMRRADPRCQALPLLQSMRPFYFMQNKRNSQSRKNGSVENL
jgi:hypothetical protein